MKTKIAVVCCGALILAAGCVSTVNDRTTPGVPLIKDRIEARYPRPVDQVFEASKDVVKEMGALLNESTLYGQTNAVKTVEGRVNQCHIWVRIEGVEPNVTAVTVQARTQAGGADIALAAQIDKEIALKLVGR